MELLRDADFSGGLLLSRMKSSDPDPFGGGVLSFFEPEKEPINRLTQWFSRENLADISPVRQDHTILWPGRCKQLAYTAKPGESPKLTLTCNCFEEYGGPVPSPDFYGWVHMGVHQIFKEERRLMDLGSLDMQMRLSLLVEDKAGDAPASQYTSQFNLCFILQNRNPESPDFNKIIWNQICLFDSRYAFPGEYCGVDAGVAECSGEFIYTMDSREMLTAPLGDGREVLLQYDWLPEMRLAFDKVQARGGMRSTRFEDLYVTDFSYGFEIYRGILMRLEVSDVHVTAG